MMAPNLNIEMKKGAGTSLISHLLGIASHNVNCAALPLPRPH